jgi:hypothetical protein
MFHRIKIGAALATAMLGVGLMAGPAHAASQTQSTTHTSFDATGSVFACEGGDITVTSGTVDQVMHFGQDSTGIFHFTGTATVHNITATDASGNSYTITGASWFGGKAISMTETLSAGDTAHFVIHNANGGVYARVSTVDHFNLSGNAFSFNFGSCLSPQ